MPLRVSKLATRENRWYALAVISLGLGIVIIDNTILNVSIPYMLRDLNADLSALELVISGYSLTIAAVLITVGRIGDLYGRKRLFLIGVVIFVLGSLIGSTAGNANTLLFGRSLIQALGAAMTLTASLSLTDSTFQGRERALAFGIWGSIAGASATLGPLLGGYLTSYYSWRWSLRINVFVGLAAILGSVFVMESVGEGEKKFDWGGTFFSGAGLFCLVYAFIEGRKYGWWTPNQKFSLFNLGWPLTNISIIPFMFAASVVFLILFVSRERRLEREGQSPLLELSMFRARGFTIGILILAILTFGQFGTFFMMPVYLENVLGLNAFQTGILFLPASIGILIFGALSGVIAERIEVKWPVIAGLFILAAGSYLLIPSITLNANGLTLAPSLFMFGVGFGLGSAQLNNIILSSAPLKVAGEASAISVTMRQVGGSIGVAIIGSILAASLMTNANVNIQSDRSIPDSFKDPILSALEKIDIGSGEIGILFQNLPPQIQLAIKNDVNRAIVESARMSALYSLFFVLAGAFISLLLIPLKLEEKKADSGRPDVG